MCSVLAAGELLAALERAPGIVVPHPKLGQKGTKQLLEEYGDHLIA
jgi:hypothetical protein